MVVRRNARVVGRGGLFGVGRAQYDQRGCARRRTAKIGPQADEAPANPDHHRGMLRTLSTCALAVLVGLDAVGLAIGGVLRRRRGSVAAALSRPRPRRATSAELSAAVAGVNASSLVACIALAALEGALVALPCPGALARLERLRSPAWAVGPCSLLVGTFGVLALPALANGLAVLAAIATPALAVVAVLAVVRGRRRALLLAPPALAVVALAASGWPAQLAACALTALGCLTLGVAVVRLTPVPWLHVGVLAMGALDVLLLALGVGQPAAELLRDAMRDSFLPAFHRAELGPVSKDYPDLVLAAVLGGFVAGRPMQRRAAALVAILAAAYSGLLVFTDVIPATVPLVIVLALVEGSRLASRASGAARTLTAPSRAAPRTAAETA